MLCSRDTRYTKHALTIYLVGHGMTRHTRGTCCALVCAVGQIWREIITRRKLPRRCCENSIATKLFGKHPTRAGRMHTRIDTAQDGYTNTHLASVACDVSCWRLVACLCRFARSLCVCGRGESYASFLNAFAVLLFLPLVKSGGRQSQGENYDDDAAKTLLQPNGFASNQRAPRVCRL